MGLLITLMVIFYKYFNFITSCIYFLKRHLNLALLKNSINLSDNASFGKFSPINPALDSFFLPLMPLMFNNVGK